jgi:hypothetical protein
MDFINDGMETAEVPIILLKNLLFSENPDKDQLLY